jgi:hypothetical protein
MHYRRNCASCWLSTRIFMNLSNINFPENSSSKMRADKCGQTNGRSDSFTETRTDMTKLIAALRDYTKAPDNCLDCN